LPEVARVRLPSSMDAVVADAWFVHQIARTSPIAVGGNGGAAAATSGCLQ
jgi:hypothetical protein